MWNGQLDYSLFDKLNINQAYDLPCLKWQFKKTIKQKQKNVHVLLVEIVFYLAGWLPTSKLLDLFVPKVYDHCLSFFLFQHK